MSGRTACRAKRCSATIPRHMVMCKTHWFMVPKPIQYEIWRHYRLNPGGSAHLAAIQSAVEAVAKREAA